ncbi:MAG: RNA polymerase-binding protein DksA, partial [Proteobacteria bacterium]
MQEEQLEQIKVRLEEMQAEILGESEETVHGM